MQKATVRLPDEMIERQYEYMHRIKQQSDRCSAVRGRRPMAYTDTYGCQQNEADTELLRGMCLEMGYDFTGDANEADLIIVNTCAVRNHAEMRALGNIGALSHIKRRNPGLVIAVCGCMAQRGEMRDRLKKSFPYVDIVFGACNQWRFPEMLFRKLGGEKRLFDTGGPEDEAIAEGLPVLRQKSAKAWLSVMYGCNNFCSYCIVPYVRGRERSRSAPRIVSEMERLVESGVRDVTLLGQNVNSYGRDLDGGMDFSGLLKRLNDIDGDFIVRFMTSHPKDASDRLFDTIAACEKIERHIHLPFQSGSDRILGQMNRGYTSGKYEALVTSAREKIRGAVFTSDVIVGFPGETAEDFEKTLELIQRVEFDSLFTFIYSPRKGTPAADMPQTAGEEEIRARFQRLLDIQNGISERINSGYLGKTVRVLVDGETDDKHYNLSSRTSGGKLVHLRGEKRLIGQFADAVIEKNSTWTLFGRAE